LRHVTADGRRLIDQIDLETRFGEIKRCLNAADAAADNHHVADIIFCEPRTEPRDLFVFHILCPHHLPSHIVISSGAALRSRQGKWKSRYRFREISRRANRASK
jgi:hypothetical protein